MEIPTFQTQKELFDFLVSNKETLITAKKAAIKHADGIMSLPVCNMIDITNKAEGESTDPNILHVKAVINTTNILDSHGDVHWQGLWNKSLQETKQRILFLQEHDLSFKSILAKGADLNVYVKTMTWKEMGYDVEGTTEALIFDATIKRNKTPEMFDRYKDKEVDNHSVGMRYVKVLLAINNKDYGNEHDVWEKHIDKVINRAAAEAKGYMWIVKEAIPVEGSAVPLGSNFVTPTLSVSKSEPDTSTQKDNEPSMTLDELKSIIKEQFKTVLCQ